MPRELNRVLLALGPSGNSQPPATSTPWPCALTVATSVCVSDLCLSVPDPVLVPVSLSLSMSLPLYLSVSLFLKSLSLLSVVWLAGTIPVPLCLCLCLCPLPSLSVFPFLSLSFYVPVPLSHLCVCHSVSFSPFILPALAFLRLVPSARWLVAPAPTLSSQTRTGCLNVLQMESGLRSVSLETFKESRDCAFSSQCLSLPGAC